MGVWGEGVFENDNAMDWLDQLLGNDDITLLRNTLLIVVEQKSYLEMPDCCRALAAAEIVASAKGEEAPALPSQVEEWLFDKDLLEIHKLVPLAREVTKKIESNSELKDLWDASPNSVDWYNVIGDIEARLD